MSPTGKNWEHPSNMTEYAVILALGWALCVAALTAPAAAQDPESGGLDNVTLHLKWMHAFQFAGYYAAKELGYYREEGLDVTINQASIEHQAVETVIAGGAEYGVWGCEVLNERLSGKPFVVLAVIFQHSPYIVLSRKDAGIRAPSDLIGRKVMVDLRAGVQFLAMLTHEGVSPDDVEMVPHTWCIEDIINGRVDASLGYVIDQPNQMRLQGVEPFVMRPIDYGIDFYGDCLFTTEAEIERHPERVAAFRRASLKGWEYAMSHEDELIEQILGLPGVQERGLTAGHLRYEADRMQELILPKLIEIGHVNPGRWKHIADTCVSLGMLDADYSLEGLIYEPSPSADYRWLYALLGSLAGITVVAVLAWLWNRQLRTAVGLRTRELHESEERYRAIAEDMPVLICRFLPGGEMTYVNEAYCNCFGKTSEELVGRTFLSLIPEENREAVMAGIAALTVESPTQSHEHPVIAPDGETRWQRWTNRALFDARGKAVAYQAIGEDITERKQAEEALRESEERLRQIAETIEDVFWITDWQNQETLFASRAYEEIWGRSLQDLYADARNWADAIHPEDRERAWENFVELGEGNSYDEEYRIVRPDGSMRWVRDQGFPVRDVNGHVYRVAGIAQDITERKRAEEEKTRLEEQLWESRRLEAIGQLAGGVAHDFNNQLAGIINYAELLLSRLKDNKERGYADMILKTAQRSADLTSQLLAFSRKAELRVTRVDIHELVAEVVSLLSHTIDRRITIKQRLDADPPIAMGDASQLESALLNITINARDAMPDGGELGLATDVVTLDEEFCRTHPHGVAPGRFLLVSVSDTGTGMGEETLAHIFEPFFTTKGVGAGTGLGLAAVYGTVRSHGGTIDVHSKPGHGSVFKVYLPLAPAANDNAGDDAGDAKATTPGAVKPACIMFVDDEKPVRESSCEALRRLGYEMVPCENGAAAVEYYRKSWRDVDLVILDMMMPEMNGHDTFRAMRAVNPGVKAMLLSGFSLDTRIQAVLDEGVLDYLQKPFPLAELYDKVAQTLATENRDHETRATHESNGM